jgi:putative toxin-antitoxin system antitoxin component (TIGR02293 family)
MEAAVRKIPKVARPAVAKAPGAKPIAVARHTPGIESFSGAYLASPIERVEAIRRGLPASVIVQTGEAMNLPREQIYTILHLPRATVSRKISSKTVLSPEMSERLLGLRKLIGQVEVMVRESGRPDDFVAAHWVAQWLTEPSAALGGRKPRDFMDTAEGREIVSSLIARMQSGAYA